MNLQFFIHFDRSSSTYKPGENVQGHIEIFFPENNKKKWIKSFTWKSEGIVSPTNPNNHPQMATLQKFFQVKVLHAETGIVTQDEVLESDKNKLPFNFMLLPKEGSQLLETYVGAYMIVSYEFSIQIAFTDNTTIEEKKNFHVQVPGLGWDNVLQFNKVNGIKEKSYIRQEQFRITPETFKQPQQFAFHKLDIIGVFDSTICEFSQNINGTVIVKECDYILSSIDLQMIRVEKIWSQQGRINEASEIQSIQIIEGNVTRGIEIPFTMLFPKFFSCPNFQCQEYVLDFLVNFTVTMMEGVKMTLNFPLHIVRR